MGCAWSTWSEPLIYFTWVPDNGSWGMVGWMVVKTRIERAPRPLHVWVRHVHLEKFKELLPNLARVWTLHPEKSNARTGRRKTGLCLIPAPSLISCVVVLTCTNSLPPENPFPQLIIMPVHLSAVRGGPKEWGALSILHPASACTSFWCRKEGRGKIACVTWNSFGNILPSSFIFVLISHTWILSDNCISLFQNFSGRVSSAIVKYTTALFSMKLKLGVN